MHIVFPIISELRDHIIIIYSCY